MLHLERQWEHRRDDRRERMDDDSAGAGGNGGDSGIDYYAVVDNLINSTISSDSETFIEQMLQTNGQ